MVGRMGGVGVEGRWPGPFGVLSRRDRDPGPRPPSVPRPWQVGKLISVPAGPWPAPIHPITDSNEPEAGDGPLPVPDGTAS